MHDINVRPPVCRNGAAVSPVVSVSWGLINGHYKATGDHNGHGLPGRIVLHGVTAGGESFSRGIPLQNKNPQENQEFYKSDALI